MRFKPRPHPYKVCVVCKITVHKAKKKTIKLLASNLEI